MEHSIGHLVAQLTQKKKEQLKDSARLTDAKLSELNDLFSSLDKAISSQVPGETSFAYMSARHDISEAARTYFPLCVRELIRLRVKAEPKTLNN